MGYVDNLEAVFKGVMRDLLQNYVTLLDGSPSTVEGVQTDLMDDLHKVALDMYVLCATMEFGIGMYQC